MTRERDPLAPTGHWRIDLRLVDELPEDNLVGTRFIINVAFTTIALAGLIFAGWLGYKDWRIRHEINDWAQRLRDSAAEVKDIQAMQKKYAVEAAKIDQAWTLARPTLRVYEFLADLGRTRPEPLVIDLVDWNDTGIVVRCNIRDTSEAATRIIGGYVRRLNQDEKINARFNVVSTDLSRGTNDGLFRCEITFRLRAAPKS